MLIRHKWGTKFTLKEAGECNGPWLQVDSGIHSCYCCILLAREKESQLKQLCANLHSLLCGENGLACSFYVLSPQINCKILFIENSFHLLQMFIERVLFAGDAGEDRINELLILH